MSTPLLHGFPPVVDDHATVLILGSFPSALSLATGQYYANPRNAFWPIAAELFGFDVDAPYDERLAALLSRGVALWDVVHKCRRIGSADSAIEPKSLVVNDFGELFADYPTITRVFFNGAKAADLYRRLAVTSASVEYRRLPSTSPAHAVRGGVKLAAWAPIASAAEPGEAGRRRSRARSRARRSRAKRVGADRERDLMTPAVAG